MQSEKLEICKRCGGSWTKLNRAGQCFECGFTAAPLNAGGQQWDRPRPWQARSMDNFVDPAWQVVDADGAAIVSYLSEADARAIAVSRSLLDVLDLFRHATNDGTYTLMGLVDTLLARGGKKMHDG